jgi:hypothetical protein
MLIKIARLVISVKVGTQTDRQCFRTYGIVSVDSNSSLQTYSIVTGSKEERFEGIVCGKISRVEQA